MECNKQRKPKVRKDMDEQAFKELVVRHRDLIWSVCKRFRLSAAWQTEDAFNEVLCALWQSGDSFSGRSTERTWVFRVANNTLVSLARRIDNQSQGAAPATEAAYSTEEEYHLAELIEQLEEPDRTIVRSHLYGFKHAETAKMVGMSTAAVSMRLTRALRKLRKLYNQ